MEIVADILAEALNGTNKTRIMFRANMNFLRFQGYLSELQDKRLIAEENTSNGRVVYRTTDAGRRFLNIMRGARELVRKAEEIISV